ncbi:MAG: hypothetical protein ACKOXW_01255 [Actinomycetes bacterium]
MLTLLGGEVGESVEVFLKSDAKKNATQPTATSVKESLWWIPVIWRVLKWLRKHNRKKQVTTIRLRKDEEVLIRKKESPL